MPRLSKEEFRVALNLYDKTVSEWAREEHTLRHPDTGEKVTRQAAYRAINENGPAWIINELAAVIKKAREDFPEYYQRRRTLTRQ